jgi:thioredoxin 1
LQTLIPCDRGNRERKNRNIVAKVNVDEQQELANAFGIKSIPTLALVQGNKVVATLIGVQPKAAILSLLNQL